MTINKNSWDAAFQAIENLRTLPKDFDGNGSERPNDILIDETLRLARQLQSEWRSVPNDVYPAADDIVIEWQKPDGVIDRICVESIGKATRMISYPAGVRRNQPDQETQFYDVKF